MMTKWRCLGSPASITHYKFFVCAPGVRLLVSTIGSVLVISIKTMLWLLVRHASVLMPAYALVEWSLSIACMKSAMERAIGKVCC
jgi:hypothetical protein